MSLIQKIQNLSTPLCALIPYENFQNELSHEIGSDFIKYENIFIGPHTAYAKLEKRIPLTWAKDIWPKCSLIPCPSITQGATELKKLSPRWVLQSISNHRRAQLIQEKLKTYKANPIHFMQKIDSEQFGAWTLLDKEWILACSKTFNPIPLGEFQFLEDKKFPPTRAYLKLWEVFTIHIAPPKKSELVIDLGSCPGGWTWVLQSLGCQVISIDKAPLDEKIAKLPGIKFLKKDAFTLKPDEVPKLDWLFSDIICTPERLFELVQKWRSSGRVKNFVCTIKFKGKTDFVMIKKFMSIPGSRVIHLNHNKHEATWILTETC